MADITIRRHQSIFDPSKYPGEIHIIGVGATGSRVFMALVELGCTRIHCYDFDTVEAHNLANQAYLKEHIGMSKIAACRDLYIRKTGFSPPDTMHFHDIKVNKDTVERLHFKGTVFLLVDSIQGRKDIFQDLLQNNVLVDQVIETRMASTHGNVFHFDPSDEEQASKWFNELPTDESTELSPCGQPISVGTTASIIANLAVWQFMLLHVNPEAADKRIDIFLKPFMASAL